MKSLADCRLYTFIDRAYLHGRAPEMVAQQLCDGGSDLIQLRAKKFAGGNPPLGGKDCPHHEAGKRGPGHQ